MSVGYAAYEFWKGNYATSLGSDMKNIVLCMLSLISEDPQAAPDRDQATDFIYSSVAF